MRRVRSACALGVAAVMIAAAGACSSTDDAATSNDVTLLVHDSFSVPDEAKVAFEKKTGYHLNIVTTDSGQALISKLKLTKDAPVADAVYGFTDTTSGDLEGAGVIADAGVTPAPGSEDYRLPQLPGAIPVDTGAVCVNIDTTYFAAHKLAEPQTLDDLTDPAYRGLLVSPDPAGGDTGLAFFYATIAAHQANWGDYWRRLVANDVKIVHGWSEAYEQEFTQGGGAGSYPIVVSYATSPAATVAADGQSATTKALPKTCLSQTEYAGVLEGAQNPRGGKAVVEWLTSPEVQATISEHMYMYPVREGVDLPQTWSRFAPRPPADDVLTLAPATIRDHREQWLRELADIIG
ncbi:thiamine ABC transporter substrate-binding protein [Nanchangia anserum]|uniref:Thiamine ABC transporter substrate-binding protein n=1 Tax=Nanchangia anserum TaxID=2692125 RepID=A0A8I0G7I2_9ACTO|nr:thiamine ABC transporter substrate-binding protein [Nanchangia anserum]MBD3689267.1 thiamine ABC transporter substrate-binding protein [Nanchangia anserum]QOX81487.1 thiamine ABC transporter substrate-binding protein [Nanchangia anserum]